MKFKPSRNRYEASNVWLSTEPAIEAKSYDWWVFVREYKGKIIFNEYPYSITTQKHQSKVRQILRQQGVDVDLWVSVPDSLSAFDPKSMINELRRSISAIETEIAKPRTRSTKNDERKAKIRELEHDIKICQSLAEKGSVQC